MKAKDKLEEMTIKDIKLYKENAEYDVRNSLKEVFDKYPFVTSIKMGTFTVKREDIANLHVKTSIDIEL